MKDLALKKLEELYRDSQREEAYISDYLAVRHFALNINIVTLLEVSELEDKVDGL